MSSGEAAGRLTGSPDGPTFPGTEDSPPMPDPTLSSLIAPWITPVFVLAAAVAFWRVMRAMRLDLLEEIRRSEARLREETRQSETRLRDEAKQSEARLREEIQQMEARLTEDLRQMDQRLRNVEHGQARVLGLLEGLSQAIAGRDRPAAAE